MDAASEVPASAGLLPGVRVLDLSTGIAGPYCAKVMADLGTEVIKVEPPEGDESRSAGPFPDGVPDPEKSARFLAFNSNKLGVTLDLATENGRRSLLKLVETADVVVESTTQPSGFDYETLCEANPRLIMTSITPFGDWGPYARYKATDLVLTHMSGHAAPRKGPEEYESVPVRASGEQSELVAGLSAATVTLMELFRRRVTGLGCHVVVSAYEAMVNQRFSGLAGRKQADPPAAGQRKPKPAKAPAEVPPYLPCGDGRIVASPRQQAQWERWLEVLGDPEWASDDRFATVEARNENRAELWELQSEVTRQHSKHELARIAQQHHVPCFPVNAVIDLLDDEHLNARGFFKKIDHPGAGVLTHPGAAYQPSGVMLPVGALPAPSLGEHNREILDHAGPARVGPMHNVAEDSPGRLPLEGVRVLDLGWVISAPLAARYLSVMGAEVIKVGSQRRAEFQARTYNQSKLSCTINISTPDGADLLKRLVALSDVVVENMATGTIDRLGLGYDDLRKVKPDIIMVSSSGLGHTGPDKSLVAYGSLLQHYTGWNAMTGGGGIAADPWVAMELAMVTAAALDHRAHTGRGQYIDFSMAESLIAAMAEPILAYQLTGQLMEPMGNAHDSYAPHGVYPCRGDGRWVAIAVSNDGQWRALCDALGRRDLKDDPDLQHAAGRRARQDELDAAIAEWTSRQEDYEAMTLLQEAGVPAGPSLDGARVHHDPQLLEGGYLGLFKNTDGDAVHQPGVPWRFSDGQTPRLHEAPALGDDNDYVFKELLGLSDTEIGRLVDEKVIY